MILTAEQFDLVIIGGGPGGYSAALYAASAGVKVAMVEGDALGGTCLNRGCIPAKAFLETAAIHRHVAHAAEFGIEASQPSVNFAVTQQRKKKIVAGLVGGIAAMCKGRKVEVFNGTGRARTRSHRHRHRGGRVDHGGHRDDVILLASGSVPRLIPDFERGGPIMTSDEVLDLDARARPGWSSSAAAPSGASSPRRSPTSASQVTILEGLPKILPGLDKDLANVVVKSFKKKKIDIRTGVMVNGHTPNDAGGTTVHFGAGDESRTSRSTPWSCRSGAARSPTSSASTAPASRSTSGASSSSTSSAAPARTACTPSAT